ncbi:MULTISPECIES: hypothetical protein [Neomoorella]|uniref:hypothetical protein n=1 Tax=Neomoorella TaxID=44260 RepID=UPI001FEC54A1|nr:hypothetical protein [Moorella humiferrea]
MNFRGVAGEFAQNAHAFYAISALGELLGECDTTYIFVDEAELGQLEYAGAAVFSPCTKS